MADLQHVVADNLRGHRSRRRMRQIDLAGVLHISQPALSALEAGSRDITLTEALIICRTLDITLAELLRGADAADLATFGL